MNIRKAIDYVNENMYSLKDMAVKVSHVDDVTAAVRFHLEGVKDATIVFVEQLESGAVKTMEIPASAIKKLMNPWSESD